MRSLAILVGAATITVCGPTQANPVLIVNDTYVEQVPGTSHVQITRTYSSGATSTTAVSRDGTALQLTFETTSGGSRDLGSGMSPITMHLGCDCSVPVGSHNYVVAGNKLPLTVVEASAATGTVRTPSAQCDTKCASTIVAPPATGGSSSTGGTSHTGGISTGGVSTGGISTGDIHTGGNITGGIPNTGGNITGGSPNTGGSTGTTSATGGATVVLENGGSTTIGGTTSTPSTGGPNKDNSDSSGCTVSRTASGLLPLGVMVALGLLVLRRRK